MNYKIILALSGLLIVLGACISIFIHNDNYTLLKIQTPLIIFGSYFMASFTASYILDRMTARGYALGLESVNPFKLFILIRPYINWFLFGFFGLMSAMTILILIFVA